MTQKRLPQPRRDEFFLSMKPDIWPSSDGPVTARTPRDDGTGGYAMAMAAPHCPGPTTRRKNGAVGCTGRGDYTRTRLGCRWTLGMTQDRTRNARASEARISGIQGTIARIQPCSAENV